jgi:cation diffusion facilitator family transporter
MERGIQMEPHARQKIITRTAILGIAVNLVIASTKIIVGTITSSLAILSEGMNNATDAATSVLTLVGAKLSGRHPDAKHPFGYGRIEYLTSLVVGILIVYTGFGLLLQSADGILHPVGMSVNVPAIVLVAVSAIAKFILGTYTIACGKKADSGLLTAVGRDGRNDSYFSVLTIASAAVYLMFHVSLDAFVGVVFSVIILKSGSETLRDTLSELIGRPGQEELERQLYKELRATPGILNAADMMLHNYGPNNYSGSVNLELDHKENLGDIYEFLHELQLRILQEYRVTMVFGLYAVNNDSARSAEMRTYIAQFVREREHVLSYHALYESAKSGKIYCDIVVDYELDDWEGLKNEFTAYMKKRYPKQEIDLTVETEYV